MKQVVLSNGVVKVKDVPSPQIEKGKVLVKTSYSCISIGTEISGVKANAKPLWKKALENPQKVKKVFDMIQSNGIKKTKQLIERKLERLSPLGYSVSGIVIGVGEGIHDIKIGDRVACAGAQAAYHAEIINVPRNLVVHVPNNVTLEEAAPVTLGAIAMQGVRRAKTTLGETFIVIGLGVIGQITVQLLKASGCRVIVSDLDKDRIAIAQDLGADSAIYPDDGIGSDVVRQLTGGIGADGVIITAGSQSSSIIATALKMCRKKGRVVVVGNIGLNINRNDLYANELDLFISTSYGPGRYDNLYEEEGVDYPIGYVRWTENRNMQSILQLLAEKKLHFTDMIQSVVPIENAERAYRVLASEKSRKPLMVLLSYPHDPAFSSSDNISVKITSINRKKINIALIGAGGFAKSVHLPNIHSLSQIYHLRAVMSRTGYNAMAIAEQYDADYATTNYQEILKDTNIDAVLITTRHNLHKDMVLQALQAGKHALVEKPLVVKEEELKEIKDFYKNEKNPPLLLTGFNRRFSKYAQEIKKHVVNRRNPFIINYIMNAGYIPLDSWVHTYEGGGRNIGEACHIYDLFNFFTDAKMNSVIAHSIKPATEFYSAQDNFAATISYEDGSICNLIYTAMGNSSYPKEKMEIFFDGKTIVLDDYKELVGYGVEVAKVSSKCSEKGQLEEIKAFADALKTGEQMPIPLWQQFQAMEIAFEVEEKLNM